MPPRRLLHFLALTLALAGCATPTTRAAEGDLLVERGERRTADGDEVEYALFAPLAGTGTGASTGTGAAVPAVVLLHGFARSHAVHVDNARDLARRGFVVLVPDMVSLLGGTKAQERNIRGALDHLGWLVRRSAAAGDPLAGRVDGRRLGLAGHSAGGAVAFEAAALSAGGACTVTAVCLLDAVPWERTLGVAERFPRVSLASFRSEPGDWNAQGRIRSLLDAVPFSVEDLRIVGASHVDPERPTTAAAALFAGPAHPECQDAYARLMGTFFDEALASRPGYRGAVEELRLAGKVVIEQRGSAPVLR